MYRKKIIYTGVSILALFVTFSCKKDKTQPIPDPVVEKAKVVININHTWGTTQNFATKTQLIHPDTDDTLNFATFKYYISNIKLLNENGNWWSHPESYFLVDFDDQSTLTLTLEDVPTAKYLEMSYVLGVDSLRNVSGAQTGALSTVHGMFWTWSTGYIMVKAEGTSPNSSGGSFSYHLGGFQGVHNIVTEKFADFNGDTLHVQTGKLVTINLSSSPDKLFQTLGSISNLENLSAPGAAAKSMATDFYSSFIFVSIEN